MKRDEDTTDDDERETITVDLICVAEVAEMAIEFLTLAAENHDDEDLLDKRRSLAILLDEIGYVTWPHQPWHDEAVALVAAVQGELR